MAYSGLNLGNVKNQNRSSILKLLNDHGPMPRKDLSARLGLTPASLTTLCGELLAQNILFELGEVQQEDKRAGRRKILLGINYAYRHVLSISIEAPATSVTLCDLRGEHCITRRIPTDTNVEPEVFLKRVANVGKALLWENSIGRHRDARPQHRQGRAAGGGRLGARPGGPGKGRQHPRLPRLGSARAGNCPAG